MLNRYKKLWKFLTWQTQMLYLWSSYHDFFSSWGIWFAKTWFVPQKWLEGVNKKLSKTSQNIRFLAQFLPFFKTTRTNMPYLMHYLTLHHWSKFQTNLTSFEGVLHGKPPKIGPRWLLLCLHVFANSRLLTVSYLFRKASFTLSCFFLKTDIALQTIYKVISVLPKAFWYWICHFHCN